MALPPKTILGTNINFPGGRGGDLTIQAGNGGLGSPGHPDPAELYAPEPSIRTRLDDILERASMMGVGSPVREGVTQMLFHALAELALDPLTEDEKDTLRAAMAERALLKER